LHLFQNGVASRVRCPDRERQTSYSKQSLRQDKVQIRRKLTGAQISDLVLLGRIILGVEHEIGGRTKLARRREEIEEWRNPNDESIKNVEIRLTN
jgi:hypothetical protein